jgi:malonate transporter and related proteins
MIAFESLIPVFLIILTGWALRHFGLINGSSWIGFEKVTFHVLMPALVTMAIVTTDFGNVSISQLAFLAIAPALIVTLLLLLFRNTWQRVLGIDGAAFTSVFQGSTRWNAFVAFGLVLQLYGKPGLSILSVAICVLVPFVNVVSAYVLSRYGRDGKPLNPLALARTLALNPFIWSTTLGLIIKLSGIPLPKIVLSYGDILGRSALATGLLLVGSGLVFSTLRGYFKPLTVSLALKLVLSPIIAGELGLLMGFSGAALAVPVIVSAAPSAASAFVMARQNGGDPELMAAILTVQTLASVITLPLLLFRYAV